MKKDDLFNMLRNKDIIAILDGDKKFTDYEFDDGEVIKISMPYLSGPDLCKLSTRFGFPVVYSWDGGNKSRWEYLDELLKNCIEQKKCSDLLIYMFAKERFSNMLQGHTVKEMERAYQVFVNTAFEMINGILYFSGCELAFVDNSVIVRKIGEEVFVNSTEIKNIDREYVRSMSERAINDVEQGNYDSAITHSRTLLEETFCYVLEKRNINPTSSGNINELYKQVKTAYGMHTDAKADKRINKLLSGLNSIVSAIAEMRNKDSDSHGVGATRIRIEEHHARLLVNSAVTMSDFILSVASKKA